MCRFFNNFWLPLLPCPYCLHLYANLDVGASRLLSLFLFFYKKRREKSGTRFYKAFPFISFCGFDSWLRCRDVSPNVYEQICIIGVSVLHPIEWRSVVHIYFLLRRGSADVRLRCCAVEAANDSALCEPSRSSRNPKLY